MAYETLNDTGTYTESDAAGELSETSTQVSFTGLSRASVSYLYHDTGSASIATAQAAFETYVTSYTTTGGAAKTHMLGWGSDNTYESAQNDFAGISFNFTSINIGVYSQLLESTVYGGAVGSANLSPITATTYYCKTGVYSSLGQYGGLYTAVFSDSGFTTLLEWGMVTRSANVSYRYFFPITSLGTSGAATEDGYIQNVTLSTPAAGLDLTSSGFTQAVDAGTDFTRVADCIVVDTMANNITSYVAKDYGAGIIAGDFVITGAFVPNAVSSTTSGRNYGNICSVTNTLSDAKAANIANSIGVRIQATGTANQVQLKLAEIASSTEYLSAASTAIPTGKPIWFELSRDTAVGTYGTAYLKLYNDPDMLSQYGSTLSVTLAQDLDWRYLNAVQSYSNSDASTSSFSIGGVNYTAPDIVLTVTTRADTDTFTAVQFGRDIPVATRADSDTFTAFSGYVSNIPVGTRADTDSFTDVQLVVQGKVIVSTRADSDSFTAILTYRSNVPVTTRADSDSFTDIAFTTDFPLVVSTRSDADSFTAVSFSTTGFTERFTWRIVANGSPITGATPTLTWEENTTGYLYDFNDSTFKASGWTTVAADMSEVDSTNLPGVYAKSISTYQLSGTYTLYAKYSGATTADDQYSAPVELVIVNGIIVNLYNAPTVQEIRQELDNSSTQLAYLVANGPPTAAAIRAEIDTNSTQLAAITAKTEQLTFTQANVVDSHIQYVAGEQVVGSGTANDPWNPA